LVGEYSIDGLTRREPQGLISQVDFRTKVFYVSGVMSTVARESFSPLRVRFFFLLVVFLPAIVPGCSIWDSATSYFNTYYNAQRLFGEAEEEIWSQKEYQRLGRNYYLGPMTNANKAKFTSVIEKCSKLLQYHPESNLVDDALFMIGMSYYYESDDQAAERKFRELLTQYPNSSLALRSRLMLAYCLYRENSKDSAATEARALCEVATQEGKDEILGHASFLLGQLEQESENFDKARQFYLVAGENGENPELRATAYFAAAEVAEKSNNFAGADSAYRLGEKVSRTYIGEYRGQIGTARMRALQGDYEGALRDLFEIRSNGNYREFFPEIYYEIANVYRSEGSLDEAKQEYAYIDTAYARTEYAANADYQLGLMYERRLRNLDSARVAYNRGRTQWPAAAVTSIMTQKAEALGKYVQCRNDLIRIDSVRHVWVRMRDSILTTQDSSKSSVSAGKPDSAMAPSPRRALPNIDSLDQKIANLQSDLGSLFYASLNRRDSVVYWYHQLVTRYPNHEAVPRALYTLAQIASQDSTRPNSMADSLYREIVNRFPSSVFAAECRRILGMPDEKKSQDSADAEYATAEKLLSDGKYADAVSGFHRIVDLYPGSPLAPRAQYAIGWVYENNLDRPDSAISNYQLLVSKFPTSPYVSRVQAKLMEVQLERSGVKRDTVQTAKPAVTTTPQRRAAEEEGIGRGRRARQEPAPEKPDKPDKID
jgi:TolA-binding protein